VTARVTMRGTHRGEFPHHVLDDDAETFAEALAGLREGLDELGGRVAWAEFVVGRVLIHDLARPPEVPVEMIS